MPRKDSEAIRITSATRSQSQDISRRQRRYLVSMAIRTLCFILAIVFAGGLLMWVFIAASFLLPTVAVVAANVTSAPEDDALDPFATDLTRKALSPPHVT